MGHSDTVQIKKETDGSVEREQKREIERECERVWVVYITCVLMCLPKC